MPVVAVPEQRHLRQPVQPVHLQLSAEFYRNYLFGGCERVRCKAVSELPCVH